MSDIKVVEKRVGPKKDEPKAHEIEVPENTIKSSKAQKKKKDKGFKVEEKDGKTTVVVTNLTLFTEELETRTEQIKKALEEKQQESDISLAECFLPPIHLACQESDSRTNLALIEIKNKIATATNGHILVKIDLSQVTALKDKPDMLKKMEGKFIHMNVWEEMSKCKLLTIEDDVITTHKDGINKMFEFSHSQGEFFKTNSIIDEIEFAGEEPKRLVFLNTKLLGTLAKIFETSHLHVSFTKGENKGMLVFPYHGCGSFAVLMPLHEDKAENRYFFT